MFKSNWILMAALLVFALNYAAMLSDVVFVSRLVSDFFLNWSRYVEAIWKVLCENFGIIYFPTLAHPVSICLSLTLVSFLSVPQSLNQVGKFFDGTNAELEVADNVWNEERFVDFIQRRYFDYDLNWDFHFVLVFPISLLVYLITWATVTSLHLEGWIPWTASLIGIAVGYFALIILIPFAVIRGYLRFFRWLLFPERQIIHFKNLIDRIARSSNFEMSEVRFRYSDRSDTETVESLTTNDGVSGILLQKASLDIVIRMTIAIFLIMLLILIDLVIYAVEFFIPQIQRLL